MDPSRQVSRILFQRFQPEFPISFSCLRRGKNLRGLGALARTEEATDERDRQKERDSARKHKAGEAGREGTATREKENFALHGILIPFDVRFYRGIARSYISFFVATP